MLKSGLSQISATHYTSHQRCDVEISLGARKGQKLPFQNSHGKSENFDVFSPIVCTYTRFDFPNFALKSLILGQKWPKMA